MEEIPESPANVRSSADRDALSSEELIDQIPEATSNFLKAADRLHGRCAQRVAGTHSAEVGCDSITGTSTALRAEHESGRFVLVFSAAVLVFDKVGLARADEASTGDWVRGRSVKGGRAERGWGPAWVVRWLGRTEKPGLKPWNVEVGGWMPPIRSL